MANLFKPWIVRHVDAEGKRCGSKELGAKKVKERSEKWYGQYKNLTSGKYDRVPLYTDKKASEAKLAELVKAQERGEAGLIDPHTATKRLLITDAMNLYVADLDQKGRDEKYRRQQQNQMDKMVREMEIATVVELTADALDRWLGRLTCSARSKNGYRQTCIGLINFLVAKKKLAYNPLNTVTIARGEKKRKRRALPVEQLQLLLDAARSRPLHEAQTVRPGKNKGQRLARVKPEQQAHLERIGRHRALLYLTAIHTGLRAGELRSLRVCDLQLDKAPFWWALDGERTKNSQDAKALLGEALASELRDWIAATGKRGTDSVFEIEKFSNLCKLLRKDLQKVGIPYQDDKGRYFDFHALRKCTGTYLRKAGIDPSMSQKWMRHSDIRLTMEIYNDEHMAEMSACLDAMPKLTLR